MKIANCFSATLPTSRNVPQGVSLSTLLYLAQLSNVTTWITKCMLIITDLCYFGYMRYKSLPKLAQGLSPQNLPLDDRDHIKVKCK